MCQNLAHMAKSRFHTKEGEYKKNPRNAASSMSL